MKKIKYMLLVLFVLLFASSALTACSKRLEDHSNLLEAGYIYRVTLAGDSGWFGSARNTFLHYNEPNIKAPDPTANNMLPIRSQHFVRSWYIKKNVSGQSFEKEYWDFSSRVITLDMMEQKKDAKTGITYYDFVIYPEWEVFIYIDYKISFVDEDLEYTYSLEDVGISEEEAEEEDIGDADDQTDETTPTSNDEVDPAVLWYDYKRIEEIENYQGHILRSSRGTAVPEEYTEGYPEIEKVTATNIKCRYFLDKELTQRIRFPLEQNLRPEPEIGKNRLTVYVAFFDENYNVIARPADISSIGNRNYYLWRDMDMKDISMTATESYSGKFIGNGFTISNASIISSQSSASSYNLGIFGDFRNGRISDVAFENCTVTYNMTRDLTTIVHCGLLAGSVSGSNSVIKNVSLINCRGYIRNEDVSKKYNTRYGNYTENDLTYVFNNVEAAAKQGIKDVTTQDVSIKYYNIYMTPTADERTDYKAWIDSGASNKSLQFGDFNQMLSSMPANQDNGRPEGHYIGVEIFLSEVEGVMISILGGEYVDASDLFTEKDGQYFYRMFVDESIKAGLVIVKWNNELEDEYKYLVTGGSGELRLANGLPVGGATAVYDRYSHTLTYGIDGYVIEKYEPTAAITNELKDRPAGHAIPLRIRTFAKIKDAGGSFENITFTINGETYDISEVDIKTSAQDHSFEFWLPVDSNVRDYNVVVNFYGRYSVTFSLIIADGVTFAQ